MTEVHLYAGENSFSEHEVGRLKDDQVEAGQFSSTTYPGHLLGNVVYSGAKWGSSFERSALGRVADDRRTIERGDQWNTETLGEVEPDGSVYLGTGYQRVRAGRVDPPHAGAAACLVLLFLLDAPASGRGRGSTPPPERGAADAGSQVASAAAGFVAGTLWSAVKEAWRKSSANKADHVPHEDAAPLSQEDAAVLFPLLRRFDPEIDRPGNLVDDWRDGRVSDVQVTNILWQFLAWGSAIKAGLATPRLEELREIEVPLAPKGWHTGGWKILLELSTPSVATSGHSRPTESQLAAQPAESTPVPFGEALTVPGVFTIEVQAAQAFPGAQDRHGQRWEPHGRLVVAQLRIRNDSKQPASCPILELVDEDGTVYSSQAGIGGEQIWFLSPRHIAGRVLQPRSWEEGQIAFDVPVDARPVGIRVLRSLNIFEHHAGYAVAGLPPVDMVDEASG